MKAMQEQTPYNTSPEQGWSQMKVLLDREMPVQKRSRRTIFFWWSFTSLMLIGLSGTVAYQKGWMQNAISPLPLHQNANQNLQKDQNLQHENQKADQNLQKEQNSQKEKISSGNNDFAANSSSNEASSINQNKPLAATPRPNKSAAFKQAPNHKETGNKNNSSEGPVALVASAPPIKPSTVGPVVEPAEELVTTPLDQNKEEVLTNIQLVRHDQSESAVTENVPSLDMMFFTIPEDELGPVLADEFVPVVKHHPTINPGIEANVLTAFNGGVGWYAGAVADVKIASRFSLTTGLGYRAFNPDANLFSASKADVGSPLSSNELIQIDTLFDGFYVPSEAVNKASYEELDPVIESVHQWQASAGMDWRFSKRFSVEGGFGIAFRTRAFSEYPIVPPNYPINSAYSAQFSNSLDGYEVIRQTMTSCFAGLTYHIGKHIALKAQWFHTFQPYLDTDRNETSLVSFKQRDDYIRGITLGLKYSIL